MMPASSPNHSPLVYIVVLAWNHKLDTLECLQSFLESSYPDVRILVVDNGSTDGTPQEIGERYPTVEVVKSETNLGVSGGYNLGMEYAFQQGANYILIANNDIIVDPDMCQCLVEAMVANPCIGIAMPKIYHYFQDRSRLWCVGAHWRRFPPMVKMDGMDRPDGKQYSMAKQIEYAPSCCLMLSRSLIDKIGYFDTRYFFYYDDWDYSARCNRAGMTIQFVPEAKLWHKVSVSTQKSEKPSIWWTYFGRSVFRFYKTHATLSNMLLFTLWFILREGIKLKLKRIPPVLSGIAYEYMTQNKHDEPLS